ncbi:MAG: circadian clock KaiB family protein [Bacteroidia bacterium]
MSKKILKNIKVEIEAEGAVGEKYILRLFISGILPNSSRAVVNINAICQKYLKGRYELEIIDIYQQPDLALSEDIIAIPLLIKKLPLPEARMIGDLSDIEMVLKGLSLINSKI